MHRQKNNKQNKWEAEKIRDVFLATGSKMGAENMIKIDVKICTLKIMNFNDKSMKIQSTNITENVNIIQILKFKNTVNIIKTQHNESYKNNILKHVNMCKTKKLA